MKRSLITVSLWVLGFAWTLSIHAGTIRGVITDAGTGLPIPGIDLDLLDQNYQSVAVNDSTSATGEYVLANVPAGQYIVRADPSAAEGYVDQYSGGVFLRSQASFVTVPSVGEVVVDFSLSPGALIVGRITVAGSGIAAASIDLDLFTTGGEFISSVNARTDSGGNYRIGALPPGSYVLRADPEPAQFLVERFYLTGTSVATATPISVTDTTDVTGIDFEIEPGGTITGLVADPGLGLPLAGFDLDLFTSTGTFVRYGAITSSTGFYEIGPVPPGQYLVRVDPEPVSGYIRTFYPNVFFEVDATPVTVTAGMETAPIDIAVPLGGTISGTIRERAGGTPLAGIDLDVFDSLSRRVPVDAASGVDGSYLIGGLPAGDYKIRADPTLSQGYAVQYFTDSLTEASGTFVSVTVGNDTGGTDFNLDPAGVIQGTIVDAGSLAPLAGIDLDLFDAQGKFFSPVDAITSATGYFVMGPVPFGTWFLQADPTPDTGYADRYFQSEYALSRATAIQIQAAAPSATANLGLEKGGFIAGTIRSETSMAGLQDIDLDVFFPDGRRLDATAKTDASGNYRLGPIPAGSYLLRADPPAATGLVEEYYDGVFDATTAQPITVSVGTDTTGIDFSLGGSAQPTSTPTPTDTPTTPPSPTSTPTPTSTATSTATSTPTFTATATTTGTTTATPTGTPSSGNPSGDFDNSGKVDAVDLVTLLEQVRTGTLNPTKPADLDGDMLPTTEDLILFTLEWRKQTLR